MNLIREANAFLADQVVAHMSDEVVFTPSATGVDTTVRASIGRTAFDTTDDYGRAVIRVESRDFIVATSVFDDLGAMPVRGDRFTEGDRVYEVLSGPGIPPWKFDDADRFLVRVHTKLVEE